MTHEEYDNANVLEQVLYDRSGMLIENHFDIEEAMEIYARKYHREKLKSMGIISDSPCTHPKMNISSDDLKYCDECGKTFGLV